MAILLLVLASFTISALLVRTLVGLVRGGLRTLSAEVKPQGVTGRQASASARIEKEIR